MTKYRMIATRGMKGKVAVLGEVVDSLSPGMPTTKQGQMERWGKVYYEKVAEDTVSIVQDDTVQTIEPTFYDVPEDEIVVEPQPDISTVTISESELDESNSDDSSEEVVTVDNDTNVASEDPYKLLDMTVAELESFAEDEGIDLSEVKLKNDILETIQDVIKDY